VLYSTSEYTPEEAKQAREKRREDRKIYTLDSDTSRRWYFGTSCFLPYVGGFPGALKIKISGIFLNIQFLPQGIGLNENI
jgi:hypothetical protein